MNAKFAALTLAMVLVVHGIGYAESKLISTKVDRPPVVDGKGQDPVWEQASELVTHDKVADLDIVLKSVYTDDQIFFMVRYADPDESRLHKPWVWNETDQIYKAGPEREDVFVFKWALKEETDDLSVHADLPYDADVWFWKAHRTDPVGFADDKIQHLSATKMEKSKKIKSKSGKDMFLQRKGDQGKSAYKSKLQIENIGDKIAQFEYRSPTESRADVKAKGLWENNSWCVEFSRPLITGQPDDIQLDIAKNYLFGVSRYEIAGRKPDPKLSQPLYGSGDVSEKLVLHFNR